MSGVRCFIAAFTPAPKTRVSLDGGCGIKELRALYEHLQARILEMIETLDDLRASAEMEVLSAAGEDEGVIGGIVAGQRKWIYEVFQSRLLE